MTAKTAPLLVDVHSHFVPPSAFDRMPKGLSIDGDHRLIADGIRSLGRGTPPPLRDFEAHRRRQSEHGIEVSVIGPWMDAVRLPLDPQLQRSWCRVLNDCVRETTANTGHSVFVAALPDLDGEAAAEELQYAVERGAVGGMLSTNPELGTLARKDLDALWATASRLNVPLILHPASVDLDARMQQDQANILVGNPFETTMAVLSLIAARVPDRFPDLKIMLVHGGGFFPYQFGRMVSGFHRWPNLDSSGMRTANEYVRWFYYDTMLFEPEPLHYLLDLVGTDHVLAGSDCPFPMAEYSPYDEGAARLQLSDAETTAVLGGNARELFALDTALADADAHAPAAPAAVER